MTSMLRMVGRVAAVWIGVALLWTRVAVAQATPSARLQLDGRQAYAGMAFTLALVAEGFDESPAPSQPTLTLPGAQVTPLGAEPSVQQSVRNINGQLSASRIVTWVLRYRVEVPTAQTLSIPSLMVTSNGKKASTRAAKLEVATLPTTPDMTLALALPDRPVWIGEPITVHLDWVLRRSPDDPTFAVPLLGLVDDVALTAPTVTDPRSAITFTAGSRDVELPFVRAEVDVGGGVTATRLRFTFTLTPKRAGTINIPASSVAAGLAVGRPDIFGNASTRLFRVSDVARTIEIRPLPQTGRPSSFAGAVGTGFGLGVRASRSVVSLGEPVELEITVRGESGLDVLSLPRLDGDGGLPKSSFTVPSDPPIGELAADGKSKVFRIAAQVIGPATEIPKLSLSYFDPVAQAYRTVQSEPIALSVKGSTMVGANDVVGAVPSQPGSGAATPAAPGLALPTSGNDLQLALSAPGATLDAPSSGSWLWIVVALLYAIPVGVFGVRAWQRRSAGRREEASELRVAQRQLHALLATARTAPARDCAGPVVSALRAAVRATGRDASPAVVEVITQIESAGFAPSSSSQPLPAALCDAAAAAARDLRKVSRPVGPAMALVLLVGAGLVCAARPAAADGLADGRAAYQNALAVTGDATARRNYYVQAADQLGQAAAATPDRPELLTDWGNAALGAGDVGTATLAFRRALAIDAQAPRARQNLAWLRSRMPPNLKPSATSAADTLLFFHAWPRARRILVGAIAFALAVLLVVPWTARRRRGLRALAIVPAAAWLALSASVVLEADRRADAVVTDSTILRTADSVGAPAALSVALPAGAEVELIEQRDGWVHVRLPDGKAGWLPSSAATAVTPST